MKSFVIIPLLLMQSSASAVMSFGSQNASSEFVLRGDYTVGGLFSLHASGASVIESCSSLNANPAGYLNLQVMRFAVEEINNSSKLLPNITLGYEILDTCYIYNNIQPALAFMSKDYVFDTEASYTNYIPKVISVIGPDNSDSAETTADLFNLLLIPQINIFATSKRLSDLSLPSCFQTVASSKTQQGAIIDILTFFNWTWIAVLGSSDEYGHHGIQSLIKLATDEDICVAYQGTIPIKIPGKEKEWNNSILQIVHNVTSVNVNVIVVLSVDIVVLDFFRQVLDTNLQGKVWIATETWSLSTVIYNLPNIQRLGVVLGIAAKYVDIPGIEEYLSDAYNQTKGHSLNPDVKECNQDCQTCLNSTESSSFSFSEDRVSFSIYAALYAVAHALHIVLGCNDTYCNKMDVYPWQITDAFGQVNFSLLGNLIHFDQYGDSPTGYDIVIWNWLGKTHFEKVGSYPELGNLVINPDKIKWQTANNQVPSSLCSPECRSGQEKRQTGNYICCFICVNCSAGQYLNENGICIECSQHQWSTEGSTFCYEKTRVFLTWNDTLTIAIFTMTILGMLLTVVVIVTFIVHLKSPVVKAAGGKRCFLMLPALATAYLSILAYLGEPDTMKCILRLPFYSLALTICFSYISIRSFQIVCIFKMSSKLPATYDYWVKQNGQYVFFIILCSTQVLISCVWVSVNPPMESTKDLTSDTVLLSCSQFTSTYNILQYSYNAFLSLMCFTFAYMCKEVPKNYNEAKCITFTMLIYFVICIFFFTAQLIDVGEYVNPINAGLALASLLGITGGYFMPKCYIIFLRPQRNTTKYFQSTIQSYTKRGTGSTK
ncbi:taste receptor type 1 member 2 [Pelobates cultripes]|uniref:Taste receptor type 1 member 2 n=1 Tax=Pelobates cultripes TaxID=61616 RepID=A0AAD1T641_PELCU|nr:taste receptor type 1 member 2 [Pelobates cultripes]